MLREGEKCTAVEYDLEQRVIRGEAPFSAMKLRLSCGVFLFSQYFIGDQVALALINGA